MPITHNRFYSKHQYYNCNWRGNHHLIETRTCWAPAVRADAIEADVWDEICELFQDPDKLWDELKAAQQNADEKLGPMRDKLQINDDLIKHFQGEADKIAAALPDTEKGGEVRKSLKEKERAVNARLDELAKQREKQVKEIEKGRVTDERIETIMTIARKVKRGIERATFKVKRRTLEALDVKVTVNEGKYHIECIVGTKDGEIRKLSRVGKVSSETSLQ